MIALPARQLVRWRGWVIGAWAVIGLLFVPKAAHVQRVLAVRGTNVEQTESARASLLIRESFPNPIAEYVAIVVHGIGERLSQGLRHARREAAVQL